MWVILHSWLNRPYRWRVHCTRYMRDFGIFSNMLELNRNRVQTMIEDSYMNARATSDQIRISNSYTETHVFIYKFILCATFSVRWYVVIRRVSVSHHSQSVHFGGTKFCACLRIYTNFSFFLLFCFFFVSLTKCTHFFHFLFIHGLAQAKMIT